MSASHNYGSRKLQSTDSVARRPANADEHMSYVVDNVSNHRNQFPGHLSSGSSVIRPTSSLAGAIDESTMSPGLVYPHLPSAQMHEPNSPYYPEFGVDPNYSPEAGATTGYMGRSMSRNSDSSSSSSRRHLVEQFPSTGSEHSSLPANATASYYSSPSEENAYLRERVRQLEQEYRRARVVIERLRGYTRPPHSSTFQAGWDARTETRMKLFCSLNRAGNALCAWHDSRRERRIFAPRNAPQGFLNCGCTYEEALFEESLSRHGVGSYHPGEAVRMDPALRNPLLTLLKRRYNYKDGDFDLDPINETWAEGQTPEDWQRKGREGKTAKSRP